VENRPPTARTQRKALRIALVISGILLGLYIGTYAVLSRYWRSDYDKAFAVDVTGYVPLPLLLGPRGYNLHLRLTAFYEPLWRVDGRLGGPSPIIFCEGISKTR
jgi:hypothetical protein